MSEKKTILIIDDSNTNVVLLEAILSTKGFTTITALSVKEALSLIKDRKPHLILLDLMMPEIDGFEFLEKVRSENQLSEVPVIVVSALTDEENIMKSKKYGAIEFIKKPVDINSLVSTVESIFNNPSA
ncbi:MAG: response regulator [Bacteroidales bacterium]